MNQKSVEIGKKYKLTKMQYSDREWANGMIITIVAEKSGRDNSDEYYRSKRGIGPKHYTTDNGLKVMSCNLEELEPN